MLKVKSVRSHWLWHAPRQFHHRTSIATTMSAAAGELVEFGAGALARISLGVPRARNPSLPFEPARIATSIGDHPIVGVFDDRICGPLLQEFAATKWAYISVVRLGYPGQGPSECPATIIVAVRPHTLDTDGAAKILRSTTHWLYAFPELHDVAVEIIEADVSPYADNKSFQVPNGGTPDEFDFYTPTVDADGHVARLGPSIDEAFRTIPAMGTSLGSDHSGKVGTLGAYVALHTPGKYERMALTCHHVLSGKLRSVQSPPPKDLGELTQPTTTGSRTAVPAPGGAHLPINSPSSSDMSLYKAAIKKTIKEDENCTDLTLLQLKAGLGVLGGPRKQQLALKELRLEMNRMRDKGLSDFSNHLGTTYCTSGITTPLTKDDWIMDWGLVKLSATRSSYLASACKSTCGYDQFSLYAEAASHLPSGDQVEAISKPGGIVVPLEQIKGSLNRRVFKCGRTTGKTEGILNSVNTTVNMKYEFDDGTTEIVVGKALLVVSPPQSPKLWCGLPIAFGHEGDSGSLVFDHQGKVLGMYFGGHHQSGPSGPPSVDGIHFVSPMHLTLDAIRAAVTKPGHEGGGVQVDFIWGMGKPDPDSDRPSDSVGR